MNDNDIIKAYKCCYLEACNCTGGCPYRGTSGKWTSEECWRKVREDLLDLIDRQKAENESLRAILEAAEDHYSPLPFKGIFDQKIAEAKTEAIKEFAERLEDDLGDVFMVNHPCVSAIIDNLVKEMTEEQE